MKKKKTESDDVVYKTSIVTNDSIYEMVYEPIKNKTYFVKCDILKKIKHFVKEIRIEDSTYKPLPPDHILVDKKIILFPSQATPCESEEKLLKEIQDFIHKYLDISPVFERIATYYVLFTWMYDKFNEVPYLRAIGDYGSGKSRFIKTIGSLCYKPIFTGGATTTSPIFRIVDEVSGTLVLDEADFRVSDMTSDIVKILNGGYEKGANVLRSEGKGTFEVKAYNVYCPKIIATRETFSDKALESRFLVEEMGSSSIRKDIPRTLDASFYNEATCIRNKLLMWRLKNYFRSIEVSKELIEGIHPRLNQIAIPLLSIIKDKAIQKELKEFIIKYNEELVADRGLSWESDIIFAILKLEHETHLSEVTMKQIADEVNQDIDISDDYIQPRRVGWYVRTKLQLKSYKNRKGFMLNFKTNKQKLEMWKGRFGITDDDIKAENT